MSQLPRPQPYVQNVNVKHKDCRFKKTRGVEDTDEKHGRQKMPNIDGVIPAVSGRHDGSVLHMEHS